LVLPSAVPLVTALFDWDTQPFILPPPFPIVDIAGEGAVMTTSDLYGTVLLFGGEGPSALTKPTLHGNQYTETRDVEPQTAPPSPRAHTQPTHQDNEP
jgi:hypothetical protein